MAANIYSTKDNQWREFYNPLRGITLERIVGLIEQGEHGALADVQWFYQAMERSDALITTVIQRRRAALMSCNWDVVPEEKATDPQLAQEQSQFLRDEYDKVENLREAVAFLALATFRGYSHVEKNYGADGSTVRLEPVEQWFWVREGMFGPWQYNRTARPGVTEGEDVSLENFVILDAPVALDRILSVQYFHRNVCMRDWAAYLDVYGIPSAFIVGPPNVTADKEAAYLAIAEALIKDGRGYLPNGTDVKFVTGGMAGKPPFRDQLDYLDKQITLLGTGGLLTMLTESGSGTLAGGAHSEAFKQVAASDAAMVTEVLQRDFDKPLLDKAFPEWPVEAGIKLSMDPLGGFGSGVMPPGGAMPGAAPADVPPVGVAV